MTSTASAPHVIQLGIPIVDNILAFVQANPFLALAILFFLYNKWKGAQSSPHNSLPASLSIPNHKCACSTLCHTTGSQPWPDFGGNIKKVASLAEWDELLKVPNRLVVIDAYALWCPPCKAAAPVYAKLSEEFTEASCCFAKVDVDHARDVAQRLGIQAMPTFKVIAASSATHIMRSRSLPLSLSHSFSLLWTSSRYADTTSPARALFAFASALLLSRVASSSKTDRRCTCRRAGAERARCATSSWSTAPRRLLRRTDERPHPPQTESNAAPDHSARTLALRDAPALRSVSHDAACIALLDVQSLC